MTYTNEYQILTGLRKYFNQTNETVDIATYEIIDSYLNNPFNSSKEDLDVLKELSGEKIQFDVYSLAPNKKTLSRTLKHIKPCKLSESTAPIRTMYGKVHNEKLHIPVFTKKLELVA